MSKNYQSGFERLSKRYSDTNERYMNAILTLKENFTGFTKKAGFDPSHPEKLSPANRRQIRRYYNTLTEYTEGQPVYKMKPSELPKEIKQAKNGLDAVKRAVQMRHGRKRSKFIFIKYDGENIPRVGVRNNAPVVINDVIGYARETIEINPKALAVDPVGTILSIGPDVEGAKFFRIMAGRHDFYNAGDLNTLSKKIVQLQGKYQMGSGNHAWDNWLHGFVAYYSDKAKAKDIINYESRVKADFRERVKRENEKAKRKRK